jgi:hypothetical protein
LFGSPASASADYSVEASTVILEKDGTSPYCHDVALTVLGQEVIIESMDERVHDALSANFAAMVSHGNGDPPDLRYTIALEGEDYSIGRQGLQIRRTLRRGSFVWELDKDLTIELQRKRKDLFFLHAAAVERHGKAYLLAAESGGGKSTTTYALLHEGFGYLSDELSPIDLQTLQVLAYPHALCLKELPVPPYSLPKGALRLGQTIHIPTEDLPGTTITRPLPLGGIFLLRYSASTRDPEMRSVSQAEAAARLYVMALNALSHAGYGLDPVLQLVKTVPCYALDSAGLPETCAVIREAVE